MDKLGESEYGSLKWSRSNGEQKNILLSIIDIDNRLKICGWSNFIDYITSQKSQKELNLVKMLTHELLICDKIDKANNINEYQNLYKSNYNIYPDIA